MSDPYAAARSDLVAGLARTDVTAPEATAAAERLRAVTTTTDFRSYSPAECFRDIGTLGSFLARNVAAAVGYPTLGPSVETTPGYDAGLVVESATLPAPCPSAPYHRLRWEVQNRFQVCQDCGAEFRPGTCVLCGQPATSRNSFSCGGSHG